MKKIFLPIIASAMFLCGCGPQADPVQIGAPPQNFHLAVRNYITETFFDPYSIRDVALTDLKPGQIYFQQGYVTCLRENAKNRMGGYVGLKTTALLIHDGKVVNQMEDAALCNDLVFKPAPDLEDTRTAK